MDEAADGAFLLYTDMDCAVRPPVLPGLLLAEATMTGGGWVVLAARGELHVQLLPGASVPADAGPSGDRLWDLARSLTSTRGDLTRATLAVAQGPPLDCAGVVTELGGDAARLARLLATMAVAPVEAGPEAAWDMLAAPAKRALAMQREGSLVAAALAYRGRGRLIGPLRGDLLIRFGVSAWR